MTIVVKGDKVGTFSWELSKEMKDHFDKVFALPSKVGMTDEEVLEAQREVIRYFQDSIRSLLYLLHASVLSGPQFMLQAHLIQGGINRIANDCLETLNLLGADPST